MFPEVRLLRIDPFILDIAKLRHANIAAAGFFTRIYDSLTHLDTGWPYSLPVSRGSRGFTAIFINNLFEEFNQ